MQGRNSIPVPAHPVTLQSLHSVFLVPNTMGTAKSSGPKPCLLTVSSKKVLVQGDKGSPSSPLPVHSTLCRARASPGGDAPLPAQRILAEARPSFVTIPAFVNTNANPSLWITVFCLLKNSLHVILSVRGSREGAGQGSPGGVAELT